MIEKTIPIDEKMFPPLSLLSFLSLPPRERRSIHETHHISAQEKTELKKPIIFDKRATNVQRHHQQLRFRPLDLKYTDRYYWIPFSKLFISNPQKQKNRSIDNDFEYFRARSSPEPRICVSDGDNAIPGVVWSKMTKVTRYS